MGFSAAFILDKLNVTFFFGAKCMPRERFPHLVDQHLDTACLPQRRTLFYRGYASGQKTFRRVFAQIFLLFDVLFFCEGRQSQGGFSIAL